MSNTKKNTTANTPNTPNLIQGLDQDMKISMLDKQTQSFKEGTLKDYKLSEKTEGMIHVVAYERRRVKGQTKGIAPTVIQITGNDFLNAALGELMQPDAKSGKVPFVLPENAASKLPIVFSILKKATSHTIKNGVVTFTEDAKKFVRQRYDIENATDLVKKCHELRILNWGNKAANFENIIHFPEWSGKIEIPDYVLIDVEEVVKPSIVLD